jgi:hypothetical protein
MRTAVQLRSDETVRCALLHGEPCAVAAGTLGRIALFEADRIVAYTLATVRRANVFVFRTLAVDDRLAASVPGVYPRVCLLIHAQARAGIEQIRRLFAHIVKRGLDAAALSDLFYRRVGCAVARRRPTQAPLRHLLRDEIAGRSLGTRPVGRNLR